MSPEAQRLAIAKACGKGWTLDPDGFWCLPDYTEDLNAMHEAENTLTPFQRRVHGKHLLDTLNEIAVGYVSNYDSQLQSLSRVASAKPAQRAEAFLRTLGLWKESPCADGQCGKYRTMSGGCPVCGDPCQWTLPP